MEATLPGLRAGAGDLIDGVGPIGTLFVLELEKQEWHFELVAGQEPGSFARATIRVPRPSVVHDRPLRGNGTGKRFDGEEHVVDLECSVPLK